MLPDRGLQRLHLANNNAVHWSEQMVMKALMKWNCHKVPLNFHTIYGINPYKSVLTDWLIEGMQHILPEELFNIGISSGRGSWELPLIR